MLDSLPANEAIQYLRTIDDSKIVQAYLVLSKRLDDPTLAETCVDFLGRKTFGHRLLGASEIGVLLYGTHDVDASRALASMISDPLELVQLRVLAYNSLELINKGSSARLLETIDQVEPESAGGLDRINWSFVDSFLTDRKRGNS
jgi:hypothetical protein